MPMITATEVWQSVALVQDEIWQARTPNKRVLVTAEVPTDSNDLRGILLSEGEVRVFRTGQTVRWRLATQTPQPGPLAQIHREVHQ